MSVHLLWIEQRLGLDKDEGDAGRRSLADGQGAIEAGSAAGVAAGLGTAELDWAVIEPLARDYVTRKVADGRYGALADSVGPKPTYDLLRRKEILP